MATLFDQLEIQTETSGFASPAETYVDKRLDINELIIKDVYSTFYFRYKGPKHFNIKQDDVIVVDRGVTPVEGDLVVLTDKLHFKIREYNNQENLFGKITWVMSPR